MYQGDKNETIHLIENFYHSIYIPFTLFPKLENKSLLNANFRTVKKKLYQSLKIKLNVRMLR